MKRWYEFRAQTSGAEIGMGGFGIPAKTFIDEPKALGPVAEQPLRLNRPGGSVFDGVAIYNALERQDHDLARRHRRLRREHARHGG